MRSRVRLTRPTSNYRSFNKIERNLRQFTYQQHCGRSQRGARIAHPRERQLLHGGTAGAARELHAHPALGCATRELSVRNARARLVRAPVEMEKYPRMSVCVCSGWLERAKHHYYYLCSRINYARMHTHGTHVEEKCGNDEWMQKKTAPCSLRATASRWRAYLLCVKSASKRCTSARAVIDLCCKCTVRQVAVTVDWRACAYSSSSSS